MPESPTTGGLEGRDNTRPSGVAPGYTRISLSDMTLTFTTANGITSERIVQVEQTLAADTITYTGESGRTYEVPNNWLVDGMIPTDRIRTGPNRPVRRPGGPVRWAAGDSVMGRYAAGGYITPNDLRATAADMNNYVTYRATTCDCEMCRRDRTGLWPDTAEQRERREAAGQRRQELIRADEQRLAEVEARAEETLRMVLKPDELAHYEENDEIIVTGADGNRYRIGRGLVGNVQLLDHRGNVMANACCHPNLYVNGHENPRLPEKDAHIAQILYLRHDLERFWRTANAGWINITERMKYFRDHPTFDKDRPISNSEVAANDTTRADWARHLVRSLLP